VYENPESGGGEESHVRKEKRCSGARSVQPGDALSVGKKQPFAGGRPDGDQFAAAGDAQQHTVSVFSILSQLSLYHSG